MRALMFLPVLAMLGGCNWVMNISGLAADANKAIGASCRQTGRSLELCYQRNAEADKAQVYAGWREMHEYMVKNKLETMEPLPDELPASVPVVAAAKEAIPPAEASAEKKNDTAGASGGEIKPAVTGPRPLTSAEADEMVKNDPQVEAVLSTIRNEEKSRVKPSGPSADEKRILDLVNQETGKAPASGAEDSFGKPAAVVKK